MEGLKADAVLYSDFRICVRKRITAYAMYIDGGGVLVMHLGREFKLHTYTLLFRPSYGCFKDNYLARHTREYIHLSDLVQFPRSMP